MKNPFMGHDPENFALNVCNKPLDFDSEVIFNRISKEAKDLLNGMLIKSQEARLTID